MTVHTETKADSTEPGAAPEETDNKAPSQDTDNEPAPDETTYKAAYWTERWNRKRMERDLKRMIRERNRYKKDLETARADVHRLYTWRLRKFDEYKAKVGQLQQETNTLRSQVNGLKWRMRENEQRLRDIAAIASGQDMVYEWENQDEGFRY